MATCTVSGTFVDSQGGAISGATLHFNIESPVADMGGFLLVPKEFTTTTAADGTWSLAITQGVSGNLTLDLRPTATSPVVKYNFSLLIPASSTATFASCWVDSITFSGNPVPPGTLFFTDISGQLVLAQLPTIGAHTYLGNNTSSSAVPSAVSSTALTADLNLFSSSLQGLVPASGGGTANYLRADGTFATPPGGGGSGTVTSVSVVTAHGLSGSVATATTTPAITLSTSVNGIAKGDGTSFSTATSGTDYAPGTSGNGTGIVKSTTGTGALTTAVAGDFPTLNQNTSGNAATVTTNANLTGPITSSGNTTSVAAQTGTGSTFVMQASPTLTTPVIGAATGTSLSVSGQLTSTVSTGTAPLVVSSTTQVANLNAATAGSSTTSTTATNATNGATVSVSSNASFFPAMFASSSNSNQPFNLGSGITFNPSTNALTTTTFAGALTGHASLDLPLTGGTLSGALDLGSHKVTSVTDPTSAQDAATKNYVDTVASALNPLQAVSVASTGNYPGVLVSNVLTITATGAITIDSTSPANGARVLLKDQTTQAQNGVYDVTTAGSVGVSPVLTRAADYNTAAEVNAGDLIPVISGTVNTLTSWLQTATVVTLNTDALVFTQWTANPSSYLLKASNLSDVTSASTSINNILPAQGSSSGQFLTTNGSATSWSGVNTSLSANLAIAPPVATSGSPNILLLTGPSDTTLTASTEASDVNLNLARTVQFATGALTTQRAALIQAPSYGFVGASTLTTAATLDVTGPPKSQTNATITNSFGLRVEAGAVAPAGAVTNAFGLSVSAPTGASNNYAAVFPTGNVGINTSAPANPLSVAGIVESTSGGFKFPNASIQTVAASSNIFASVLSNNALAGSTTNFLGVAGSAGFNATESFRQCPVPIAGTIRDIYVATSTSQPAGGNLVFTLRKNAVDTALILTITTGAGAGVYSNTTDTATVVAGDLIDVKVANGSGSTAAALSGMSLRIIP